METLAPAHTFIYEEDVILRLDKLLSLRFPECSRTYLQSLIAEGLVQVNNASCKKRHQLNKGDEVSIVFALTPELSLEPENIPLDILFEDDDLLVVNKPAGMVVHPAPGHFKGTFVHALLFYCKSLEWEGNTLRPGIVHRLDKDTSGLLLAAKNSSSHKKLVEAFSQRSLQKSYKAICIGTPLHKEIETLIGRNPKKRQEMAVCQEHGKPALTRISSLHTQGNFSLLDVDLVTGRTHQIRVHLRHIGCPILGDPVYGYEAVNTKLKIFRQMLHAEKLCFPHPRDGRLIAIQAPLPEDMRMAISHLFTAS
ncbi:MAG: RluA family pseudouridine synthase [Chlamydiae bacterium]|nr:RluA family pseudouridine synthase [Chlamydiota bacterium]